MQIKLKAIAVFHKRCSLINEDLLTAYFMRGIGNTLVNGHGQTAQGIYFQKKKQLSVVHVLPDHKETR